MPFLVALPEVACFLATEWDERGEEFVAMSLRRNHTLERTRR